MNNQLKSYLFILLAVLLVLLLFAYWFTAFEYGPYWQKKPVSYQVARNPLLAAQRLLEQLNIKTHSIRDVYDFKPLANQQTMLLLNTPTHTIGQQQAERLLDWVDTGGHLLIGVTKNYNPSIDANKDYLLYFFAIKVLSTDWSIEKALDGSDKDLDKAHNTNNNKTNKITANNITLVALEKQLLQAKLCCFYFNDPNQHASWHAGDQQGKRMLNYQYGQGYVTIFSNISIFDNNHIGSYDHAALLTALTQVKSTNTVWLQYQVQMPSLWQLIWQYAWVVLLSLLVLLILWVWRINYRLGPYQQELNHVNKSLLQHIQASGQFLWRYGQADYLHQQLCQQLIKTIAIYHPSWAKLQTDELYHKLVELDLNLSIEQIEQAFSQQNNQNPLYFYQKLKTLQTIRNCL